MDVKNETREFLTSRRGKVTPEQAGITAYGARRVPGLRRSEVATLAGVSVEYYTRIERGNLAGVSDGVLDALASALLLDDAERAHLFDLARAAGPPSSTRRRASARPRVRPNVQWVLDSITGAAAFVGNGCQEVVAANPLAEALLAPLFAKAERPVNAVRFLFLDPAAHELYPDWERIADETVAVLRHAAGVHPRDRRLSDIVGELSVQSDEFRTRWASHDVRFHNSGTKRFLHPTVGELTLNYEMFDLSFDGLTMVTYTAEPGSRSAEGLALLASWIATSSDRASAPSELGRLDE